MRRVSLMLVPAMLVCGIVAATLWQLFQVPVTGPAAPEVAVWKERLDEVPVEIEHRPGSEPFQASHGADGLTVRRGSDRFELRHRIPFVNGTAFPSPTDGQTVRWNLDGPLLIGGRPVAQHRFQPQPLDATPMELMWDIKNPSDAPRDSLSAVWSRAGRVLVTAHGDGVIRVWDVDKGTVRTAIEPPAPTDGRKRWGFKAAVSPDGKTVAAANVQAAAVTLWEADTGKLLATLTEPGGKVTGLRFMSDRTLSEDREGKRYFRDLTGDRAMVQEIGSAEPWVTAETVDGRLQAMSDSKSLTLSDVTGGMHHLLWRPRPAPATALVFFADGKTLAVGAADGLRLYDTETRRERGWIQTLSIRSLAVSADGAFLAAAMEHGPAVLLWRTADLQPR
ncbi:WD40 repeat domain-containing protein [Urbifossiella limnaea]|uniref:WD domain, G-beta repeat n=1 Tax=Urbifossiella limnaea TaxID=2528023 RepID=A0A517XVZ1_9BACT|nr:hypothetical protein [Urbifossiella limnaea]QDU21682.1 WD domain, G-beta repeat [Urbifossiella limnaea]